MSNPVLSVVICTYNRDKYLQRCLDHLSRQTASDLLFEILVINNNSTDRTSAVCDNFSRDNSHLLFRHIVEAKQGLSFSRNKGLEEAKGEIISYIDDDAFAEPDFVSNLVAYFEEHSVVDAIGGKVTPIYESKEPEWMSTYLLPLVAALDMGNKPCKFKGLQFPIGANMAFRRSLLNEVSFHTGLGRKGSFLGSGEEKELFFRLKKQNSTIHYLPKVKVSHSIPDSRIQPAYIKRMATGIGTSEALRIKDGPWYEIIFKWFNEFFKIGATAILAFSYVLTGKRPKANMLIKFRWWFFTSFVKG